MSTNARVGEAGDGRAGQRPHDAVGAVPASAAMAGGARAVTAGAVDLVARQRAAVAAVLRRHAVAPAEAPPLLAEALLAVADGEGAPDAATLPGGRLVRALEIACAQRPRQEEPAARQPSPGAPPAPAPADFAALLDTVSRRLRRLHRRLAADRRTAPRRAAAALARPEGADPAAIASRGVAEHLLAAAAAAWVDDAHRARRLARLALAVVRRLDADREGAAALADLEARALATLGNAERVVGDLAAADAALAEAGRVLAAGSRDPRRRADHLRLTATLRRAQGRPAEALRLLDQATAIHRWLGEADQAGRLLLQRAAVVESDDPRQAARLVVEALAALDLRREPRLELVALHNLLLYRHRAGDLDAAAALLPRVAAAAERLGGRLDRLRLRWLAAQIAADRGDEAAAPELAAVRDAFLAEAMPLDALLAALDLAAHRLARGRQADTRQLAEELIPLVAARPLDRATLATLLLFQQAARRDRATLALVRSTATTLRRAGDRARPAPAC